MKKLILVFMLIISNFMFGQNRSVDTLKVNTIEFRKDLTKQSSANTTTSDTSVARFRTDTIGAWSLSTIRQMSPFSGVIYMGQATLGVGDSITINDTDIDTSWAGVAIWKNTGYSGFQCKVFTDSLRFIADTKQETASQDIFYWIGKKKP